MSGLYQIPGLFLTALCHAIVIYYMAEHKYSGRRFFGYGCIYVACFVGLSGYGYFAAGKTALLLYIGIVVCTFLFSCIVSRDSFSRKCFLFITYFCLFSTLDNILKLMIKLALPQLSDPAAYYAAILLRAAILLVTLALCQKYVLPVFRSLGDVESGRWWNLALIALLFYLAQAAISVLNAMTSAPMLLFLFVAISVIMCAVYGVVFSNIRYMKKEAEAALVRQKAEYLAAQLADFKNAEETHKRLRHDMRHHLETIGEYAKAGDTGAILAYIREYSIAVSENTVRQYSVNRTINSILSVYGDKVEECGIVFTVKCNAPEEMAVRDIDLIALLGNLLENALNGCVESGKENPGIDIHIRIQDGRLIIVCDNTCSDDLELSGSLPAGRSIGISSILSVCRKYDGNLDYQIENGICSACAVLNI